VHRKTGALNWPFKRGQNLLKLSLELNFFVSELDSVTEQKVQMKELQKLTTFWLISRISLVKNHCKIMLCPTPGPTQQNRIENTVITKFTG